MHMLQWTAAIVCVVAHVHRRSESVALPSDKWSLSEASMHEVEPEVKEEQETNVERGESFVEVLKHTYSDELKIVGSSISAGLQNPTRPLTTVEDWQKLGVTIGILIGQIVLALFFSLWLREKEVPKASSDGARETDAPPPGRQGVKQATVTTVVLTAVAWMITAALMMMFNKWLFSENGAGLHFPLLLSTWHQFVVVAVTQFIRVSPWGPTLMPAAAENGLLAGMTLRDYFVRVVPPAVCYAGSLGLGNTALQFLSAAFANMLRAGKPVFVFVAALAVGLERWSNERVAMILLISVSLFVMTVGEADKGMMNPLGVTYQLLTFATEIVRLIMLKMLVSQANMDPGSALCIFAPGCFVALFSMSAYVEGSTWAIGQLLDYKVALLANGALAVVINAATMKLMDVASPTIVSLTGAINYLLTAVVSMWWFDTQTSAKQMGAFIVTLVTSVLYSHHQRHGKLPSLHMNLTKENTALKVG